MRTYSNEDVQPMPPSIVQAVCKVQASLGSVHKSQKNLHGGYQFASTDDIYAALTRKMGEVGLMCVALEERAEIIRVEKDGKTVQWAHMTFSFVLATADGTWTNPRARRTLYIQVTGPQTFQAAQSYAEKAFLRSLFKIPTGDLDLDSMPQADSEDAQIALAQPKKRKSSYSAKKDGTTEQYNEINQAILTSLNIAHLRHIREVYADAWSELPTKWSELLDHEYEDKMDSFGAMENAT